MSDDERLREIEARHRAVLDGLKNAPPLEKARTFLRTLCAGPQGLDDLQEQLEHVMSFNALPLYTGLEGLKAVLADSTFSPQALVTLVKQDANQHRVGASPEEARRFLEELVALLRRVLDLQDEPHEGAVFFYPGDVFRLEDAGGHVHRMRCVELIQVEGRDYALFVPEEAQDEQGPYTVYHYTATPAPGMTDERITDPVLSARVVDAYRRFMAAEPR